MKTLLLAVILGFGASASATTLSLESLQIELASGWVHSIEKAGTPGSEFGDQISVHHPDGVGVLYLRAYTAPAVVSDDVLRRMTNVPMTVSLVKRQWGEFSGYHYLENEVFHRSWWLARGENLVFITYQCGADQQHIEIDHIDAIVQSLSSIAP